MSEDERLKPLIDALRWHDDDSRLTRAARIDWASSLYPPQGMVAGELVQLSLMEESRVCFVSGAFLGTILCATSAVEHLLVAELEALGIFSNKTTLGPLIQLAREAELVSPEILQRLEILNELRNPVAHRRNPSHDSTLVNRLQKKAVHPNVLMEKDARFAMELMYEIFLLLLKPGA